MPAGIYIAWLSDAATDAGDRLPENLDGYYLLDGTNVANDKDDLLDGTLNHAIDLDEYATFVDSRFVWTGTHPDGTVSATTNRCFDRESKDINSSITVTMVGRTMMMIFGHERVRDNAKINCPCTAFRSSDGAPTNRRRTGYPLRGAGKVVSFAVNRRPALHPTLF